MPKSLAPLQGSPVLAEGSSQTMPPPLAGSSNAAAVDALPAQVGSATPLLDAAAKDHDTTRFGGDRELARVEAGRLGIEWGDRGLSVTKLQQALIDLGYLLPKYGVDGIFMDETYAALRKFQGDAGVPPTGRMDKATLAALDARYATRAPYVANATYDPSDPGTRTLSPADKKAADRALVPQPVPGKPSVFQEVVGGEFYADRIRKGLQDEIASIHKTNFEDRIGLRADPAKNFHDWSAIEGAASAAKDVTDKLYGSYATAPPMTHAGGNLIDQWEDEIARNAALDPDELQKKARRKVVYLINSNLDDINAEHGAVPSNGKEERLLKPVIDALVDTPAKVQTLLELDIGWDGAQLDGVVYLQRFKSTDPDAAKAKEDNRFQMWEMFHTCIHEYLHTLKHPDFDTWASAKDDTRENTLVEGFCDFFTINVRSTLKPDPALQAKIEGPYANGGPVPTGAEGGVYPSMDQAEQVVSIVGIRNAQAAYFLGDVSKMGG